MARARSKKVDGLTGLSTASIAPESTRSTIIAEAMILVCSESLTRLFPLASLRMSR
ncbi:hypothetical protein [Ornithinimicrobium sp. INDO-MA30-4]|uniref:hypothetical protein n=1 Tax=Ornithinimicrobium sp. INDO-MA30-4 TaxID=2908651 RepID=UPI001F21FE06|nr:hypothetical protein [Ornithinimicrobium sp. INDO-MA30-4]UJH69521.1 hypothetical protein L0A91_09025 [Ornithinimicrobium sp. INDO-MA30-4]